MFLAVISIFFLSLSSDIHAKTTEGNYLQINVVGVKSSQETIASEEVQEILGDGLVWRSADRLSDSGAGVGGSYKYAFSMKEYLVEPFDRAFIAPGIFYDDIETEIQTNFLAV